MGHPFFAPHRTKSLRFVLFGGTVISPDIVAAATDKARLGADKAMVGFGMSEGLPTLGTTIGMAVLALTRYHLGLKSRYAPPKAANLLGEGKLGNFMWVASC